MSAPRKLTPEEVLREAERMDAEEEAVARVLAKSHDEVKRDLEAAGLNREKHRAQAEAVRKRFAALAAGKAAEAPAPGAPAKPTNGTAALPARTGPSRRG